MAKIKTDPAHYRNIAAKIREKTVGEESYLPSDMPGGIEQVYEAGKRAERKAYWNILQSGGDVKNYACRFGTWPHEAFYPQHDIRPTHCYMMFRSYNEGRESADLVERLNECNVVLDTSQSTSFQYMFLYARVSHVGVLDTRNAAGLANAFDGCAVNTVDGLILKEDGSQTFSGTFQSCSQLTNIVIKGGIIGRTFDIKAATKLTAESAKSILTHLKDYSGTDDEFAYSVLFHADVWALLDAEGNTAPHGGTWADYVDTLCWSR